MPGGGSTGATRAAGRGGAGRAGGGGAPPTAIVPGRTGATGFAAGAAGAAGAGAGAAATGGAIVSPGLRRPVGASSSNGGNDIGVGIVSDAARGGGGAGFRGTAGSFGGAG